MKESKMVATQDSVSSPEALKTRNIILKTLKRFPNIPLSMVATAVRPSYKDWRVVLSDMIAKGEVIREDLVDEYGVIPIHRLPSNDEELIND
jgi:hypothetical protein